MPDDRLNKIVQRMIDAGETEVNIAGVIKHWKKNNPSSTSAGDFWGGVRESVDPFGPNSSMGISESNMASLKGLAGYGYGAIAKLIPNAVTGTIDLVRSSELNPNIADRIGNQMKMYEGLKEAPGQIWEATKKAGSHPFEFGEMSGELTGQPIVTEGLGMIPGSTIARNVRGVTRTATRAAGRPIAAVGRALKSTPPIPGMVPRVMPLRAAQAVARPIGRGLEYVGESMKMTGSPKILQNSEYGPIPFTPSQPPISPTADLRGSSAFPETSEMAPELVPNSGAASDAFNPNQPLSSPTGPQKGSVAYPELNEFDSSLVQNSDYGPVEFTPDQPLVSPTGEGKGGMAYPETNAALPELIPNSQAALDQFGEAVLAPGGEMRGGASYPETSMRPEGVTLNNEYGPVDFDPGDAPTQPIFRPEPPPPPPPPPPNYVENVPWPESSYTEVPWGESPSMELDNPWVDTPTHPGDLQGGQFSREIADSIANEMPETPPTGRGQIMDPDEASRALTADNEPAPPEPTPADYVEYQEPEMRTTPDGFRVPIGSNDPNRYNPFPQISRLEQEQGVLRAIEKVQRERGLIPEGQGQLIGADQNINEVMGAAKPVGKSPRQIMDPNEAAMVLRRPTELSPHDPDIRLINERGRLTLDDLGNDPQKIKNYAKHLRGEPTVEGPLKPGMWSEEEVAQRIKEAEQRNASYPDEVESRRLTEELDAKYGTPSVGPMKNVTGKGKGVPLHRRVTGKGPIMPPDEAAQILARPAQEWKPGMTRNTPPSDIPEGPRVSVKEAPEGYREGVLKTAGKGIPGLSTEQLPNNVKRMVVRNKDGSPLASATIHQGKNGELLIGNIAAAKGTGLSTSSGKAVMSIMEEAIKKGVKGPMGQISPDALKLWERMKVKYGAK